jgi:N-acetyl-anhydromuramyl-L-alanine amidase AmpD
VSIIDKRKATNLIVVHSSATMAKMDIGVKEIDVWHRRRGFTKVGYHYVIRRDGSIETGRAIDEIGAHARPRNFDSVGICMVGGLADDGRSPEANFTDPQWDALRALLLDLSTRYPSARIIGHRDVPGTPGTACPSFDVGAWMTGDAAVKAIGG